MTLLKEMCTSAISILKKIGHLLRIVNLTLLIPNKELISAFRKHLVLMTEKSFNFKMSTVTLLLI